MQRRRESPDGSHVFLTCNSGALRVIDTATLTVVASIHDPSLAALTMAINPAGTRLYVGGGNNGVLIVMNITNNTVVTVGRARRARPQIGALAFTYHTAITPDGAKVYTGRDQAAPLHVIIQGEGPASAPFHASLPFVRW